MTDVIHELQQVSNGVTTYVREECTMVNTISIKLTQITIYGQLLSMTRYSKHLLMNQEGLVPKVVFSFTRLHLLHVKL
jgi:hypothetical protein